MSDTRQVTLGQLLTAIAAILIAGITGWISISVKVEGIATTQANQVQRVNLVEQKAIIIDADRKIEIGEQQKFREETLKLLYEIKIELAKKQDRK